MARCWVQLSALVEGITAGREAVAGRATAVLLEAVQCMAAAWVGRAVRVAPRRTAVARGGRPGRVRHGSVRISPCVREGVVETNGERQGGAKILVEVAERAFAPSRVQT